MLAAVSALIVSACTTCYNERFCRDLVGMNSIQVVSILGVPTGTYEQGDTKVMEWMYNGVYLTDWAIAVRQGVWMPHGGLMYSAYMSPGAGVESFPQFAVIRLTLVNDRVTSYSSQYRGSDMCNHFVPESYIERYKKEDNTRRR